MARDIYLQIEGIKGESANDRHKDWIEISNVSWNIHQPRAACISTAGGMSTGRCELSELSFRKDADLSSPILQQHCAMGKTIAKAKFEFMRADGNGAPINYYTVELENILISSVTPDSGDGGIITELVSLAYSRIKWKYTQQKIAGGIAGIRRHAQNRRIEDGEMAHPVVYSGDLNALIETYKHKYAGRDQECVALPQAVTNVGFTGNWQPGDKVVDLNILRAGTVIANFKFEDGKARFPNKHGYHAAIFLEFGNRNPVIGGYTHFWVIDQWPGKPVKRRNKNSFTTEEVKRRQIYPADNANEYYVVMVP